MGAAFMRAVAGVAQPRVALLANGTEPGKGTETVVMAHEALQGMEGFAGNVEGFAIATGEADVIVTDGFTGNVTLKVLEATSKTMIDAVRSAAMASPKAKLGGALLRPALRGLKAEIDPEAQGGAYLLGLRRLAVVPHGSFSAEGWAEAVRRAARGVTEDVVGRTHATLEEAGALRRVPASDAATSL
jgi:glycerol-3-phosphate acyltransferase PlsX